MVTMILSDDSSSALEFALSLEFEGHGAFLHFNWKGLLYIEVTFRFVLLSIDGMYASSHVPRCAILS